jgi:hypothetical protein
MTRFALLLGLLAGLASCKPPISEMDILKAPVAPTFQALQEIQGEWAAAEADLTPLIKAERKEEAKARADLGIASVRKAARTGEARLEALKLNLLEKCGDDKKLQQFCEATIDANIEKIRSSEEEYAEKLAVRVR